MSFSFRRLYAVFWARNKEFYRDKGALGWVFIFPALVIVAFGYMFNLDEQGIYKVGYFGESSPPKIEMIEWIKYEDSGQAMEKLKLQNIDLVVDFSTNPYRFFKAKESPKSSVAAALFEKNFLKSTATTPVVKEIKGKAIRYIDWLFPGLLTMNVLWMALWGVGWVVVRQRKIGVLKRFKASPLTAFEYLLAQILSRIVILLTSGMLLMYGARLIYPFQNEGSLAAILVFYVLGCLALCSIGLIVAARMSSEEFANGFLNIFTYPMMFLSEIWFTLEGSGAWVKAIAWCSPLWHMTYAIRKIMNEGSSFSDLGIHAVILLAVTVVFMTAGAWLFKWTRD